MTRIIGTRKRNEAKESIKTKERMKMSVTFCQFRNQMIDKAGTSRETEIETVKKKFEDNIKLVLRVDRSCN